MKTNLPIPIEELDCNGRTAVQLDKHLANIMPGSDATDDEIDMFNDSKIHLVIADKVFTFGMCAAVYNGLHEFTQFIIDEQ